MHAAQRAQSLHNARARLLCGSAAPNGAYSIRRGSASSTSNASAAAATNLASLPPRRATRRIFLAPRARASIPSFRNRRHRKLLRMPEQRLREDPAVRARAAGKRLKIAGRPRTARHRPRRRSIPRRSASGTPSGRRRRSGASCATIRCCRTTRARRCACASGLSGGARVRELENNATARDAHARGARRRPRARPAQVQTSPSSARSSSWKVSPLLEARGAALAVELKVDAAPRHPRDAAGGGGGDARAAD